MRFRRIQLRRVKRPRAAVVLMLCAAGVFAQPTTNPADAKPDAGRGRYWNAFLVPNADRVFLANEQGELIIARISPKGYEEISRAKLIKPTSEVLRRKLVWSPLTRRASFARGPKARRSASPARQGSHPAFANRCIYARNDDEIICVSLVAKALP